MESINTRDANAIADEMIWNYNEKSFGEYTTEGNSLFLFTAVYCILCFLSIPIILHLCQKCHPENKNGQNSHSDINTSYESNSLEEEELSTQPSATSFEKEDNIHMDESLLLLKNVAFYSSISSNSQHLTNGHEDVEHQSTKDSYRSLDQVIPSNTHRISKVWQDFREIAQYDRETRNILKLALPYTIKSLFESSLEIVTFALIGNFLGVNELSAFAVVELLLYISDVVTDGIVDATLNVVTYCVGNGNNHLAGQYVQIATIVCIFMTLPTAIFGSFYVFDIILWFGFEEPVAITAQSYTHISIYSLIISGAPKIFSEFLDVIGLEVFSATSTVIFSVLETVILVVFFLCYEDMNLDTVAYIDLGLTITFSVYLFAIPFSSGWIDEYIGGLFYDFGFKNTSAMQNLYQAALPFIIGSLFMFGEWQVLSLFAAHLGPDAVAAWALLGSIWDLLEAATEEVGASAEVRVGYYLGKGNPRMARNSANKALFVGTCCGFLITMVFYFMGDKLAFWFTEDVVIQRMIVNSIPFVSLANIAMVYGMLCWSISVAQGRYTLATTVAGISTWGIVIPTAAIFIYVYDYNIESLVSSITFGYVTTGTILTVFVSLSDWERACQNIMSMNAKNGYTDSSDSDIYDDDDSVSRISLSSASSSSSSSSSDSEYLG